MNNATVNVLLLDKLPRSKQSAWDSTGMDNMSTCLIGTREGVLADISDWLEHPGGGVFWLTGVAGSGKTTIALTLARMLAEKDRLGASVFCSRDQSDRSNLEIILPTIAYQLGLFDASLRLELITLLTQNVDVGHLNLQGQLRELVVRPLGKHPHKKRFSSVVVVIDAFDECRDTYAAHRMLGMFSESIHNIPLKFFITSRPEKHIRTAFQLDSWRETPGKLILHEVDPGLVQADIKAYLEHDLSRIAKQIALMDWPSTIQVDALVDQSKGLFIYAATACKFIGDYHHNPRKRLELLLDQSTSAAAPLEGLNKIYQQILETSIPPNSPEEQYTQLRNILGSIILIFDRLTVSELASLLKMEIGDVRFILVELHSVLLIPDEDDGTVRTFHPSWHDFLVSADACRDSRFFIDPARQHSSLAIVCFERIQRSDADQSSQQELIPGDLEYAARYWLSHVAHAELNDNMFVLGRFNTEQVMTWLSVLSRLGRVADAIRELNCALAWLEVSTSFHSPPNH
jgi:NACHT domain